MDNLICSNALNVRHFGIKTVLIWIIIENWKIFRFISGKSGIEVSMEKKVVLTPHDKASLRFNCDFERSGYNIGCKKYTK